jgi:hypothetical protein
MSCNNILCKYDISGSRKHGHYFRITSYPSFNFNIIYGEIKFNDKGASWAVPQNRKIYFLKNYSDDTPDPNIVWTMLPPDTRYNGFKFYYRAPNGEFLNKYLKDANYIYIKCTVSSVIDGKFDKTSALYLGQTPVQDIPRTLGIFSYNPNPIAEQQFIQTAEYNNYNTNSQKIVNGNISNIPRYIKFSCNLELQFNTAYYFSILLRLKDNDKTVKTMSFGNIQDKIVITKNPDNKSVATIKLEKNTIGNISSVNKYSIELTCYSEEVGAVATFKNLKFEKYDDILTYLENVQKITVENLNRTVFNIDELKFYDLTGLEITPSNKIINNSVFYVLYFPENTKLQKIVYNNPNQNNLIGVQMNIFTYNGINYEIIGKTLPISQIQKVYTWIYPYFNLDSANDGCGVFTNNFTLAYKKDTTNLLYSYGGLVYNAVEKIPNMLSKITGVLWSNTYNMFYCYGIRNGNNSGIICSKDGINWQPQQEFIGYNCIGMAINYYNDIIVAITGDNRLFYKNNQGNFIELEKNHNISYTGVTWGTKGFFISGYKDERINKLVIFPFSAETGTKTISYRGGQGYKMTYGDCGLISATWNNGTAIGYYEWTPGVSSVRIHTLYTSDNNRQFIRVGTTDSNSGVGINNLNSGEIKVIKISDIRESVGSPAKITLEYKGTNTLIYKLPSNESGLLTASWNNGTALGYYEWTPGISGVRVQNLYTSDNNIRFIQIGNTDATVGIGMSNPNALNSGKVTIIRFDKIPGCIKVNTPSYKLKYKDSGLVIATWSNGQALGYYEWTPGISNVRVQTLNTSDNLNNFIQTGFTDSDASIGVSNLSTSLILYSFNGINWYDKNDAITNFGFSNIYSGYDIYNRNIIIAVDINKKFLYYSNNYYNWKKCNITTSGEDIVKIVSGKNSFLLLTSQNKIYYSVDGINWYLSGFYNVSYLYYYNSTFYVYGKYKINIYTHNQELNDNNPTLYTSTDSVSWEYSTNYTPLQDIDNFYDLTTYVPHFPVNITEKIDYININTTVGQLTSEIMKNIIIYNEFNEIIILQNIDLFQIFCDSNRIYKIEIKLPKGYKYNNMFLTFYRYIYNNNLITDTELIGRTLPIPETSNTLKFSSDFRYTWVYPNYILGASTDGEIGSNKALLLCGSEGIYCNYLGNGTYWDNASPNTTTYFTSICNGTVKNENLFENIYVATCEPDSTFLKEVEQENALIKIVGKNYIRKFRDVTKTGLYYSYDAFTWTPIDAVKTGLKFNKVICGYPIINNIVKTMFITIGDIIVGDYEDKQFRDWGKYYSYDGINWEKFTIKYYLPSTTENSLLIKFNGITLVKGEIKIPTDDWYTYRATNPKIEDMCWSGNNFYFLSNYDINCTGLTGVKCWENNFKSNLVTIIYTLYKDNGFIPYYVSNKQENFKKIYGFNNNLYLINQDNKLYVIKENIDNLENITTPPTLTNHPVIDKCYNILYINISGINIIAAIIPVIPGSKNNFIYSLNNGKTWNYSSIPVPNNMKPINLIYNNNFIVAFYYGLIAYTYDFQNWTIAKIPAGCDFMTGINLINNNVGSPPPITASTVITNYIKNLDNKQDYYEIGNDYISNNKLIQLQIEDVDINSDKQVLTSLDLNNICNQTDKLININSSNLCAQFKPINKTNEIINNIFTIGNINQPILNDYFILNRADLNINQISDNQLSPYYNILNTQNTNLLYTQKNLYYQILTDKYDDSQYSDMSKVQKLSINNSDNITFGDGKIPNNNDIVCGDNNGISVTCAPNNQCGNNKFENINTITDLVITSENDFTILNKLDGNWSRIFPNPPVSTTSILAQKTSTIYNDKNTVLENYVWNRLPSSDTYSDQVGWFLNEYYSTINSLCVNNVIYTFGRGSTGIICNYFDIMNTHYNYEKDITDINYWKTVNGPEFSDSGGWNNIIYYSTIKYLTYNNKIYIFARSASGIDIYLYNIKPDKSLEQKGYYNTKILSNSANGSDPQCYNTINYVFLNGFLYIIYKLRNSGLQTTIYNVNTDGTINMTPTKTINTNEIFKETTFQNSIYYSTIKYISNPDRNEIYLCGRSNLGLIISRITCNDLKITTITKFGILADTNQVPTTTTRVPTIETDWKDIRYYSSIDYKYYANYLYIFARRKDGLQIHVQDINYLQSTNTGFTSIQTSLYNDYTYTSIPNINTISKQNIIDNLPWIDAVYKPYKSIKYILDSDNGNLYIIGACMYVNLSYKLNLNMNSIPEANLIEQLPILINYNCIENISQTGTTNTLNARTYYESFNGLILHNKLCIVSKSAYKLNAFLYDNKNYYNSVLQITENPPSPNGLQWRVINNKLGFDINNIYDNFTCSGIINNCNSLFSGSLVGFYRYNTMTTNGILRNTTITGYFIPLDNKNQYVNSLSLSITNNTTRISVLLQGASNYYLNNTVKSIPNISNIQQTCITPSKINLSFNSVWGNNFINTYNSYLQMMFSVIENNLFKDVMESGFVKMLYPIRNFNPPRMIDVVLMFEKLNDKYLDINIGGYQDNKLNINITLPKMKIMISNFLTIDINTITIPLYFAFISPMSNFGINGYIPQETLKFQEYIKNFSIRVHPNVDTQFEYIFKQIRDNIKFSNPTNSPSLRTTFINIVINLLLFLLSILGGKDLLNTFGISEVITPGTFIANPESTKTQGGLVDGLDVLFMDIFPGIQGSPVVNVDDPLESIKPQLKYAVTLLLNKITLESIYKATIKQ